VWKYFSVSTSTWGGKIEMPAFDFTGGRKLNAKSQGVAVFNIGDPGVLEAVTITSIAPWERMLVAEWDGNAVYAGLIVGSRQNQDAQTVTVRHVDIWWLWEHRHVLTVRGDGDQSAPPITYNNRTLATHANLVVNRAMFGLPTERYDLPLIMNADVAGDEDRTYYGYKFMSVADALEEIINTEGGPDVDFDTQWDDGTETFRWVMRSGELTQGLWEWDATAAQKEVFGLELDTDASNVTDRMIGAGEGSERDLLVRDADSFLRAAPALERVESYDIADGAQLQSRVNADLAATDQYTQQMSFRIPVNGDVKVSELILGGTARVKSSGLIFLTADWHDWRLIGFDFDRDWITLQLQQIGG
jgi:hypothetical protein